MSPAAGNRWIRPEVYPLFAAISAAIGLCGFAIARNLVGNPDVRINKTDRAAGYLENFKEGERYYQHVVRKYVTERPPEIFASLNKGFSTPK